MVAGASSAFFCYTIPLWPAKAAIHDQSQDEICVTPIHMARAKLSYTPWMAAFAAMT